MVTIMESAKRNKYIWLSAVWLLITVITVYLANRYVPYMMDDLWYSTKLMDDTPIRSMRDIIDAQIWHYNNWGGRSMTHSLLQLILMTPEIVADILNILATFVLALLVEKVAGCKPFDFKTENPVFVITSVIGMLIGLNANWKMSMFWESGAANYLYITSFILGFMYCYLRELDDKKVKPLSLITLWIIPLGFISGWSNENMGPVAFLVSVATIVYLWQKKMKPKAWMYLGSIFSLAGSAFCILAPGNFVRSKDSGEEGLGILWRLFLRGYSESRAFTEYLFSAVIVALLSFVILRYVAELKMSMKEMFLLAAAVLSWGAMVLSPHYPDRATFGSMVLLVVASVSMIRRAYEKKPGIKPVIVTGSILIWLRGMFFMGEFIASAKGWLF